MQKCSASYRMFTTTFCRGSVLTLWVLSFPCVKGFSLTFTFVQLQSVFISLARVEGDHFCEMLYCPLSSWVSFEVFRVCEGL